MKLAYYVESFQGGNGKQGADGDVGEIGPRVSIAYIDIFFIDLLVVSYVSASKCTLLSIKTWFWKEQATILMKFS